MCKLAKNTRLRSDGRYEVRVFMGYKENGKSDYVYGLGKTLRIAKEKVHMARINREQTAADMVRRRESLSVISEDWLRHYALIRKPSTVAKYTEICNGYILPFFGEKPINEITNIDIAAFRRKLISDDPDSYCLSNNTALNIIRVLNLIKGHAKEKGYAVNFMANGVDIKMVRSDIEVLSQADQRKLTEYIENNPSPLNLGVYLSLRTGMRIGEICGLRWGDISFDEKSVHIERTLQRISDSDGEDGKTKILIGPPKSENSIRTIPLPDDVCALIRGEHDAGQYFLAKHSGKFVEPRTMQRHFKKILDECGIEPVKFHVLRHTFATNSINAGVDKKCLSAIMGHSSVQVTLDIYVHPTLEMKRKSMAKIDATVDDE